MSDIALTVPSKAESALTGFMLGAERTIGRTTWRVEYYARQPPRIWRNGAPFTESELPASAARFVAAVYRDILASI